MENTQSVVAEFRSIFDRKGLHAALAYLNARTRHRFTGVYRFEPPMLRSVCLYDRENPALHVGSDAKMSETYCSIVGAETEWFATANADADTRVNEHPARVNFQAYCGAPVVDGGGACVGTLCHFDQRPRLIPETEIPVMEQIGRLLAAMMARTEAVRA